MLSPIPAQTLTNLRQLADKMERILLDALESYGNTFVEPKVELGARFGHLIRMFSFLFNKFGVLILRHHSSIPGYFPGYPGVDVCSIKPQAIG